jgi:glutaredoxin
LKKNKVKFEDLDVQSDSKAREEMVKKSGQEGVPVIDIDGQIIVGFDEQAIREALGLK